MPVHELRQPLEGRIVGARAEPSLLVFPMRRDPALGDQVHLARADLHLERLDRVAHHGRMERLVEVRLRHRDVVLDAAGHRAPELVHEAERGIAVASLAGDDAEGENVVELGEIHAAAARFQRDRVGVFAPAGHLPRDARLPELVFQLLADLLDHRLRALQIAFHFPLHADVLVGLQMLEGQVLQLPLH